MTTSANVDLNKTTDLAVVATCEGRRDQVLGFLRVRNWGDPASPIYTAHVEADEWSNSGRQVADFRHDDTAAARAMFGDEIPEGYTVETRNV